MKQPSHTVPFVFALGLIAWLSSPLTAQAGSKWQTITELQAGGGAKEVTLDKEITHVRLLCTEGKVGITTLWVREGGKKTQHKVTGTFEKDQAHEIDLGGTKHVTGFRISDSGEGKYKVQVK